MPLYYQFGVKKKKKKKKKKGLNTGSYRPYKHHYPACLCDNRARTHKDFHIIVLLPINVLNWTQWSTPPLCRGPVAPGPLNSMVIQGGHWDMSPSRVAS